MTLDDAIKHFGSVEKIEEAAVVPKNAFRLSEYFRPVVQMRLYVASKGKLALDENLASLIAEVVKTMFWEDEE